MKLVWNAAIPEHTAQTQNKCHPAKRQSALVIAAPSWR